MVRKNRTMTLFGRRHSSSLGMDRVCVLTFLFTVLFSTPADAGLTVLQPESIKPASNSSIVFYRQGENGYYGNNVTLRPAYLPSSANLAWFDYETILPRGALKKVFFMACDYSQLDDASTRIRLQIWRPVNLSIPSLRLVWQQVVQLPTTATGPLLYTYSIKEAVALVDGDRIGWEYEGSIGPICFHYAEARRTYFYRITNMHPGVGQLVTFDANFLPSQFSIAALVDRNFSGYPGPVGSTAATSTQRASGVTASTSSIVFYRQGENGYYGNNVTLRPACLPSSANLAWFDYETILPRGALKKVFFMACDYSQLDDASTRIRLQIWRPVNLSIPSLRLVWQQVVQLPTTATGPQMYTYSIKEAVALVDGDRIGWEYEGSIGPICFQYAEARRTYFYRITNMHPGVGQLVTFDANFLPSQFSIAALVDGNLPAGSAEASGIQRATGATEASQASCFELWGSSLVYAVSLSVAFIFN